jgi:hypothetical protein
VEPGNVAGRDLEVEEAHRTVLKHLTVMRLSMHRRNRVLPLAAGISRLPRRDLPANGDGAEDDNRKDNPR